MPRRKQRSVVFVLRQIQSEHSTDQETCEWIQTLDFAVNGQDRAGHSPLTMAAAQGKLETLKYLQSMGGQVFYRQPNGHTILTAAVSNGHYEVAQYAVRLGLCVSCARTRFPTIMDFFLETRSG